MAAKTEKPSVDDTIRLALEAANAANDAAAEIETIKSDAAIAAEKTDVFRKRITTDVFGALGGAAVAMTLSSLVYFRTISEMRKANATQIEALALFAESVDKLNDNLDSVQALSGGILASTETISPMSQEMVTTVEAARTNLMNDLQSFAEQAGNMQPEIASTINDHISAKFQESDQATMAALADMLDRLASGISTASPDGTMDPATEALIEQIILLQEQQRATQELVKSTASRTSSTRSTGSSSTRSSSASAAKPNPFSFP